MNQSRTDRYDDRISRVLSCYVPNGRVVGISKPARVVQVHTKRLQIQ